MSVSSSVAVVLMRLAGGEEMALAVVSVMVVPLDSGTVDMLCYCAGCEGFGGLSEEVASAWQRVGKDSTGLRAVAGRQDGRVG